MIRRRFALHAFATAAVAVAGVTCGAFPSESNRRKPVAITFSRAEALAMFPGAYVSVLDTAVLTITSGATSNRTNGASSQTYRARLGTRDSTAVFEVDLDTGTVTFAASVLSNNGTPVFTGRLTTNLQPSTDSVTIQLAATAPVMLLSLDFPRTDTNIRGNITRSFSATLYNRGTDSLSWNVSKDDVQGCGCAITGVVPKIGAGRFATFQISINITGSNAPPTNPPRIKLESAQGTVSTP